MNLKEREILAGQLWQHLARMGRALFITKGVQNANRILAGPASGAAADATFRALVTADLPDLGVTGAKIANSTIDPATKLSGVVPAANGGTGVANSNTLTVTGGNNIKFGRGSSFPASPATGDMFLNTSSSYANGTWFFYDGTRWLTSISYPQPFDSPYATFPVSANGLVLSSTLDEAITLYLLKWTVKAYVLTTNNSTNYWNIFLKRQDTSGVNTTIATISTNGYAANTNIRQAVTAFTGGNTVAGSSNFVILVEVTKVGSPGALYVDSGLIVQQLGT